MGGAFWARFSSAERGYIVDALTAACKHSPHPDDCIVFELLPMLLRIHFNDEQDTQKVLATVQVHPHTVLQGLRTLVSLSV